LKILEAIQEAAAGGMPMSPFVARQVVNMFRHHAPSVRQQTDLTKRELEILSLLVEGLNYAMIGERLFISLDTVRNHIRHIYEKLHVHSKSQAVAKAMRERLI
jgi:DNA-binding NarL/FixJ family response regulator